jgi:hypothetical protein
MTQTETEAKQQEFERSSLESTISGLQAALMYSAGASRDVLELALRNATSRLGTIEKKLKDLTAAHDAEIREAKTRAIVLAEQETGLTVGEKKEFAGFMREDFFTTADFKKLDQFYANSWERLSENGKDEMSRRIWKGIRKGEYAFSELPTNVREKETERAYDVINKQERLDAGVAEIPEKDRTDFIRAFEGGHRRDAEKILERESFKANLFRNAESEERVSIDVVKSKFAEKQSTAAAIMNSASNKSQVNAPSGAKNASRDLSGFDLDGVKLVDVETQGSTAELPNGRTANNARGQSTPGS